jgi:putative transposase
MKSKAKQITNKTIRLWCNKFGYEYPKRLKRKPRDLEIHFIDEVFIVLNDVRHSLWRVVDHSGVLTDFSAPAPYSAV